MNIDHPTPAQYPALQALWAEAFGDDDALIVLFFSTAFSPQRCRCLTVDGQVAAALYWLDCETDNGKFAYLYAVATAKVYRGRGLCRILMEDTHKLLAEQGYDGVILVPGEPGLFALYGKMGYSPLNCMDSISCTASGSTEIHRAAPEEYASARQALLPKGGVRQEMGLTYLAGYTALYIGSGFALAGTEKDGAFFGMELLGNPAAAPAILGALGLERGTFRIPGNKPFAMYHPLSGFPTPTFFGLAFD